jgi:hypothetical protein
MKYVNEKIEGSFFGSEEIFTKILKSLEFDFGFHDVLGFEKSFPSLKDSSQFRRKNQRLVPVLSDPDFFFEGRGDVGRVTTVSGVGRGMETADRPGSKHFDSFSENSEKRGAEKSSENAEEKNFGLSLENLNLPFRIHSVLVQNKIVSIGDLLKFSSKELRNLCGIGNFSLSLIQKKLKKRGFSLKKE